MLLVQKFLQNKTFQDLINDHGVYCSFNKTGTLFSLSYDQIEAKSEDPLSQECRGLILSKNDGSSFLSKADLINNKLCYNHICPGDTNIVAFPMSRFFNLGQMPEAKINWNDPDLLIQDKMDGTLTILFFSPITNCWNIATRSVPEADIPLDNGLFTFRTLFEKALFDTIGKSFDEYTSNLDKDITYCFELCTPYNPVVVRYVNNTITLIAARSIKTLKEIDILNINSYNVPKIAAHAYTSINELVNWVSTRSLDHEGVVVRDSNFNRIKIKSPAYVAAHKLNDRLGASERNCLELILLNQDDDIVSFLPEEIVKNLQKIKAGLQKLIQDYDIAFNSIYNECQNIKPNDKKTFAIAIQGVAVFRGNKLWTAPFFQMYSKKCINMHDFIIKNKKDGVWSNIFLDHLLELSKSYVI